MKKEKPDLGLWWVSSESGSVLIYPPLKVDREYDDLVLHVSANAMPEDVRKIAGIIASILNENMEY